MDRDEKDEFLSKRKIMGLNRRDLCAVLFGDARIDLEEMDVPDDTTVVDCRTNIKTFGIEIIFHSEEWDPVEPGNEFPFINPTLRLTEVD